MMGEPRAVKLGAIISSFLAVLAVPGINGAIKKRDNNNHDSYDQARGPRNILMDPRLQTDQPAIRRTENVINHAHQIRLKIALLRHKQRPLRWNSCRKPDHPTKCGP